MKKEILDEMIKVANSLDANGLYKEASNVDRIARNGLSAFASVTGQYSDHIQRYKNLVIKNDIQGATNYFNAVMRSNATPEQKGAFRAQAERIRIEQMHGEYANYRPKDTYQTDDSLNKILIHNKLFDTNIDKKEFDRRWTNMMTNFMYVRDQRGVLKKDNPVWNQQMNLTYNMLTQKFKR